jgi:uncharacterized protein
MSKMPEILNQAWENREGPLVFSTVDAEGSPNVVYVTCVGKYNADTIVIADNYFNKTRANIFSGGQAALLFITREGKSFQLKGKLEYHTSGDLFDYMKGWNPKKHPGHAAVAFKVESIFSGAEKLA